MLTSLRIQNFKSWRDTSPIRLAPLTVFFGANSSGKTSIHQLLLLLKQTDASPDRNRTLHLGDKDTLVDLGSFEDVIHAHDVKLPIQFELEWTLSPFLRVRDPKSAASEVVRSIRFSASIEQRQEEQIGVTKMRYTAATANQRPIDVWMEPSDRQAGKFDLKATGYNLIREQGRKWALPPPSKFYSFPEEASAYFQNAGFVADLALEVHKMLGQIFYVGPLREYPQRLYRWSGETPDHVETRGRRAVEALLAARQRQFNVAPRAKKRSFEVVIASWLQSMGLISSFRTIPVGDKRKEYEVLIKTTSAAPDVKITDVGFGVSQVLPVVVECFYVPPRSTIVFEQPEIHLHPSVQASLADLFLDALKMREDGASRRLQILVESHSEHFLRRLQRRIAEGRIKSTDTALYFCERSGSESTITPLNIDSNGHISNWPQEFFGDIAGDVEHQTEAMLKKRAQSP